MTKVFCLNKIAKQGLDVLPAGYELAEDIEGADAVLVRSAKMHDMELPESLIAIARAGAGVNNIPLDKCAEKGIVVFNTPGANANSVKELAMAGMLVAMRNLKGGMEWVDANKEDEAIDKTMEKAKSQFAGMELKGKNFGVIGLGAIGVLTANAAVDMGMHVYGYDPYLSVSNALHLSTHVHILKSNEEVYAQSDVVSIHVPLSNDTKEMINKDAFKAMKDGTILLNFARGGLINEDDLEEALNTGKIAKYVTDFPDAKTVKFPNTIAFPHLGASTEEAELNCAVMAAEEIVDYIENGNITHSVNYPDLDMGPVHEAGRVTLLHKNVPSMLNRITAVVSEENINIAKMINKSKGEFAYTVIDLDSKLAAESVEKIRAIDGIIKVRVLR